ncbi:hypothetical protein CAEBREN_22774 [Caenorhabditis brenneri]|uniref:Uncharacterized protein n=1 Tax=Caenorhabditis brenneri TaxID=135651 RepID=G0P291_CAEBE|nr:hypothetical protein CAEBREN_22774 [Caenorhabditis brenneri]
MLDGFQPTDFRFYLMTGLFFMWLGSLILDAHRKWDENGIQIEEPAVSRCAFRMILLSEVDYPWYIFYFTTVSANPSFYMTFKYFGIVFFMGIVGFIIRFAIFVYILAIGYRNYRKAVADRHGDGEGRDEKCSDGNGEQEKKRKMRMKKKGRGESQMSAAVVVDDGSRTTALSEEF